MCLEKVYDTPKLPVQGTGYRVCVKKGRKLRSVFQGNSAPFRVGEWLHEKEYRVNEDRGITDWQETFTYPYGFHLFQQARSAHTVATKFNTDTGGDKHTYVVRKVEYKNAVAKGEWTYRKVTYRILVAKEMMILDEN